MEGSRICSVLLAGILSKSGLVVSPYCQMSALSQSTDGGTGGQKPAGGVCGSWHSQRFCSDGSQKRRWGSLSPVYAVGVCPGAVLVSCALVLVLQKLAAPGVLSRPRRAKAWITGPADCLRHRRRSPWERHGCGWPTSCRLHHLPTAAAAAAPAGGAAGAGTGRRAGWFNVRPPAVTSVAPCRRVTKASASSPAFFTSSGSFLAGSSMGSSVRLHSRPSTRMRQFGGRIKAIRWAGHAQHGPWQARSSRASLCGPHAAVPPRTGSWRGAVQCSAVRSELGARSGAAAGPAPPCPHQKVARWHATLRCALTSW